MNGSDAFVLDIPADFRWEAVPPTVAAAAAPPSLDVDRLGDLATAVSEAVGMAMAAQGSERVGIEGTVADGRMRIVVTAIGLDVDDEPGSFVGSVARHVLESLVDDVTIESGHGRVDIRFSCPV
jgi:anti-sigma regulatory factor (Ser/Thr protein kinase)